MSRSGASSFEGRVLVTVGIGATVAVLVVFAWYARHVLLLAFAGLLLAVFLRRLANAVGRALSISPRWGLVIVVLALTASLAGVFASRGGAIASEVDALGEELPRAMRELRNRLQDYEWGQRLVDATAERLRAMPNDANLMGRVTGVASRTLSLLTSIAFVLFFGVVVAATPKIYRDGLLALVPERHSARAEAVIARLYDALW
jgi:predicted PurR-regulated permease PerM